MKTLATTLLILVMSMTISMVTTVYASEKEHEHKGASNAETQGGHDERRNT